ncbi:putative integral membrane protein [Lactobacillus colini]|uniref:Integral membrane protein n=1 Tax=Lactobacillus colini TaxID=1819254 RepID=A0ABS4ME52_9LACO|nr:lipopolysaccharide assembly protein LapA domain-containing protein [Lactobacillus colini]MBP2057968.1 putative integral membrane protein [Lactobacillus colini]
MKKQRGFVGGLIIVLLLVIFACLNTKQVAINFGFFQPKMPLIIILIIMILLGAVITMLLGNSKEVKQKQHQLDNQKNELSKKYESQLKKKDQEIAQLNQQLKDLKSKSISE